MYRPSHYPRLLAGAGLAVFGLLTLGGVRGERAELTRPVLQPETRVSELPQLPVNNPGVEPGRVEWHSSFADARVASAKSGKPVLLFHLMGRLDRQFC